LTRRLDYTGRSGTYCDQWLGWGAERGDFEMAIVRREVSDRTVLGKLFKYLFIAFNIFMAFALFKGCSAAADGMQHTASDAEAAGAAIGTAIGVGSLLFLWLAGDVILGLFVLFTRKKKIIEVEE
jgi:hypothetical protein